MAKKRLLLFVIMLFLFTYSINAEGSFQTGELDEGETIIYNMSEGFYILALVSVSDQTDSAVFRLNNEMSGRLREKETYSFSDSSEIVVREVMSNEASEGKDFAGYYFYASGNEPMKMMLHSINPDICNFDRKCGNETQGYCCYDCGCDGGYECIGNVCSEGCSKDAECDDNDACTEDSCIDGGCKNAKKNGCSLGDRCVENGYVDNEKYCYGNEWAKQKEASEECSYDYECLSGRCKDNKCLGKKGSKGIILSILVILLLIIVAYTQRDYIIRKLRRRVI